MNENTRQSSEQLRGIAVLILAFGVIIGILLILGGFLVIVGGAKDSLILGASGFTLIFTGVIIIFCHYVTYVLFSALATFIENSDRSDVVDALLDISDNLRDPVYRREDSVQDVLDVNRGYKNETMCAKEKVDDDVELEKIDISGIKEDEDE